MRTILVLAAALATFAPTAFAGFPGVQDVVREYDHAREFVFGELEVVRAEITTDLQDVEVGGVVLIEGTAEVDPGFEVGGIRFYVDRTYVGYGGRGERWSFELDTRRLIDGVHDFSVSVVAVPVRGDVAVVGLSGGDSVRFRTLNHVTGVVLHEATYEGLDAWTHVWTTTLERDYVGLRMTVTTTPDPEGAPVVGAPLVGQAVTAYHEKVETEPTQEAGPKKTWVATFGVLHGGHVTVMSRPPHDLLREGSTLGLAGGFVGNGTVTIRIEAIPWP